MLNLIAMNRSNLAKALSDIGVEERHIAMRVSQLWNWLYMRGVLDFSQMTNMAKDLQERLAKNFTLTRPDVVFEQISSDGTRKWLLKFALKESDSSVEAEMVYIPEKARGTLCLSSQVGCTLNCSFCHTGTQKLVRNLSAAEILAQILIARERLKDSSADFNGNRKITNIVMMGMGEPFYNFDNVKKALLIACDGDGLSFSKRRTTISTAGVVPAIARAGEEIGVMLAISLHAVDNDLRNELVPINKKYPIEQLLEACRNYASCFNSRRITFEYIMLRGINDTTAQARELVQLLRKIPAKINLIPFNPWPGSQYQCSKWSQIEAFGDVIRRAGLVSTIRMPRGGDILAACGQLKSQSQRIKNHRML